MEIWKDVINYEGLYKISNYGRVISCKKNEKLLKPLNCNGYLKVVLCKNGKVKNELLHRLVAQHYIQNPNNYNEVNHKDENKTNNNADNLEWCSHKYNINYGTGNLRRALKEKTSKEKVPKKIKHYIGNKNSKKIIQYDLQGNFIREWESISSASKELNLKKIWEVCNKKRNKCGNYIWRYKVGDESCS